MRRRSLATPCSSALIPNNGAIKHSREVSNHPAIECVLSAPPTKMVLVRTKAAGAEIVVLPSPKVRIGCGIEQSTLRVAASAMVLWRNKVGLQMETPLTRKRDLSDLAGSGDNVLSGIQRTRPEDSEIQCHRNEPLAECR
jgi:hypothetical protein